MATIQVTIAVNTLVAIEDAVLADTLKNNRLRLPGIDDADHRGHPDVQFRVAQAVQLFCAAQNANELANIESRLIDR